MFPSPFLSNINKKEFLKINSNKIVVIISKPYEYTKTADLCT